MKAKGWAVCDNGQIFVATVSPAHMTAIINWLVTERGVMVLQSDSNEEIANVWLKVKGNAECREVEISAP